MIVQTGGVSDASVTSGAEVDLLSTGSGASDGLGVTRAFSWSLAVSTTQEITVRVYLRIGGNCGLVELTGARTTVSAGSSAIVQASEYPALAIRVTAQATGTTAAVSADFIAQSSTDN